MKLKINQKLDPVIGETRVIEKFAWFPTIVVGYIIWMEKYYIFQEYISINIYIESIPNLMGFSKKDPSNYYTEFKWKTIKKELYY